MKPIILTVCAVVLMASAGWAGSLVTNESGNVEAELRDGSKLIGTAVPATLALDVKTEALGQLSIPLNRIGKIEFTKDGQVSIQLQNGDKLKGGSPTPRAETPDGCRLALCATGGDCQTSGPRSICR